MRALLLASLALVLAGCAAPAPSSPPGPGPDAPVPTTALDLAFLAPLDLRAVGYEPSIAVDAQGAIYWTAHKDLTKPQTWPYPASWFQVSRDNGATWENPASPTPLLNLPQQFVGDEGDIAVDARGWVYFVDTYLADNHLHVWSDQGRTWQSSQPIQKTTGLDDRPWISAQGQGIVSYLGNNGSPQDQLRHWYYRSTDAGLTWSPAVLVPGAGWATMDAERTGTNLYIAYEQDAGGPTDIMVQASHDSGATWDAPVLVAHREGNGREYPIVAAAPDGIAYVLWMDCGSAENCADNGGSNGTRLWLARSADAGATWQAWDVTPFDGYHDYPTVAAGPNGTVAIAFYSAPAPLNDTNDWGPYAGMARVTGNQTPQFHVVRAAPETVYEGRDLHALHDFFEIAIGPDEALHIGYMHSADSTDPEVPLAGGHAPQDYGARTVWYAQGRAP